MTHFIAIKIHYDHRGSLPEHLKYSREPTPEEYEHYLGLYRDEKVGGGGFHECLNFAIPENGTVQVYLPPTCLPSATMLDDDFVIFSFTYKGDKEMSSCVIGVHAGARILNREGIERDDVTPIEGVDSFFFHAVAPGELSTLLIPPVEYDYRDGVFTPELKQWGFGYRKIDECHARNIVESSLESARKEISISSGPRRLVLERQIAVLENIATKYLGGIPAGAKTPTFEGSLPPLPDKETGYLGEKAVYEAELEYVRANDIPEHMVEWVSQSVPTSPYDIKSVRKLETGYRDHYIEVKTSKSVGDMNIYVSHRQIEYFEANVDLASFFFVQLDCEGNVSGMREIGLEQMRSEFELIPLKYTLRKKV